MAFNLLSLIPLVGGFVGNLMGNQKNESLNNSQNSSSVASQNTHQVGQQGTYGYTQGFSTENARTNQTTNSTTDTSTTSTTDMESVINRLSPEERNRLSGFVQTLMGSAGGVQGAMDSEIQRIAGDRREFDVDGFVRGISGAARDTATFGLESELSGMADELGANAGMNSAAALLANRLRTSTASQIAGIEQEATATGEGIRRAGQESRVSQLGQLGNNTSQLLASMVGSLLGANETQTGRQTTKENTRANTTATTVGQTLTDRETRENNTQYVNHNNTQNQTGTQTQSQTGSQSGNASQHNWSDWFSGIGDIVKTQF